MKYWKPTPVHMLSAALISSMGFGALLWGPRDYNDQLLAGHSQWVSTVAFTPDGRGIISGAGLHSMRSETKLWDLRQGRSRELNGHKGSVEAIAFSPDGSQLATAGYDLNIRLWDVRHDYQCISTLPGHDGVVRLLAYTKDGRTLISAGNDYVIKFWDVASGKQLSQLIGYDAVGLAPQTGCFATREFSTRSVTIRDLQTGEPRQVFAPGDGFTMCGAFNADGQMLATGGFNWCVNTYHLESAKCMTLSGHQDYLIAVAFSPDSKFLATACQDRTVKIWDLEAGREIRTLVGHTGPVTSVAFAPDGKRLVSGSYDKTIRIWDLNGK
jgi:WD40 repeat protein